MPCATPVKSYVDPEETNEHAIDTFTYWLELWDMFAGSWFWYTSTSAELLPPMTHVLYTGVLELPPATLSSRVRLKVAGGPELPPDDCCATAFMIIVFETALNVTGMLALSTALTVNMTLPADVLAVLSSSELKVKVLGSALPAPSTIVL